MKSAHLGRIKNRLCALENSKKLIPWRLPFKPLFELRDIGDLAYQPVCITSDTPINGCMNPYRGHNVSKPWVCTIRNCKRESPLVMPLCEEHVAEFYRLRIAKSRIPGAGLGLFVVDAETVSVYYEEKLLNLWGAIDKSTSAPEPIRNVAREVLLKRLGMAEGKGKAKAKGKRRAIAFEKGEFICFYSGEHLTKKQFQSRYQVNGKTATYTLQASDNAYLDGAFYRCPAHYINQTMHKSEANVCFADTPHCPIFALRDIEYGEELLAEYRGEYDLDSSSQCVVMMPSVNKFRELRLSE